MEQTKNNSNRSAHFLQDLAGFFKSYVWDKLTYISSETLGWIAIIIIHGSTIPSLIAMMTGLTDKAPAADIVLLVWLGLLLFFIKSVIQKDMLIVFTIGFGFVIQASMMALIFFK